MERYYLNMVVISPASSYMSEREREREKEKEEDFSLFFLSYAISRYIRSASSIRK